MSKKKKISIILIAIVIIISIIVYVVKTNRNITTSEKVIEYRADILALPYGTSDINVYADGNIWAKSVERGKAKTKISQEELEEIKQKLIEIDYMNLNNEYNVYGEGSYEEIIIKIDGNEKKIRLNYIVSRYDSTNLPKELKEFMRMLKQTIYEEE